MDEVVGRSKLLASAGESVRLPVAHMVCNQTPPVGEKPSLMTFRYRLFEIAPCVTKQLLATFWSNDSVFKPKMMTTTSLY